MTYQNSEKHLNNLAIARQKALLIFRPCIFCNKNYTAAGMSNHEKNCYLNPSNIKHCSVCSNPIKNFRTNNTCSYSCSNTYFRSGPNHGNWKLHSYRSTCFHYHQKRCIVCNEENIVEVHHLDENHNNNLPENLIPLCPTHHQYWHSKFKYLVENKIINYINDWSIQRNNNKEYKLVTSCSLPEGSRFISN